MENTEFQSVPLIESDESVLVIEYDKFNLYEYDFLREEIEPTRFIRTIDSCDILRLQLGRKNVKLLMVHFNAEPIEGCYIIQLFRILHKETPVIALFDEYENWRAEAEQAKEFGFSAGLLNPITTEKWHRLCDHLDRDNSEFVVIE
jgi:hypothetical protein